MKGETFKLWMAGLAFGLLLSATSADAASMRRVRVDSSRIALGDVLRNAPASIANLDLGPSPRPGKSRVLKGEYIRKRLRQAMIQVKGLRIPHRVRVDRPSQILTELQLQSIMRRQLPYLLPGGIIVKSMKVRGGVVLARGPIKVGLGKVRLRHGRQTVTATVQAGDSSPKLVIVALDIEQNRESDILYVKRGQPVIVMVRLNGVTIRAKAVAQQDGRKGQLVAVLPLDGRKLIRGRVVESGTVEVEL